MKRIQGWYGALGTGLSLLLLVCAPVTARDGLSLSAGAEYSSGDYGGTSSIDQLYVPLTARYRSGRWGLRLTVPFLSVSAPPGTLIIDSGGMGTGTGTGMTTALGGVTGSRTGGGEVLPGAGSSTTQSGLGDVIAGATLYDVVNSAALNTAIDLTGKIKFGTADYDKGLGTGENDYAVQADAYSYLGRLTTIVEGGYRLRGDPPGYDLNNTAYGAVGGSWHMHPDLRAGLIYQASQAPIDGGSGAREATLFVTRDLSARHRFTAYVLKGFSDGSPDWGAGLLFTASL
ncbi:MAG TPA: hypothetical protein VFA95_07420 [Gammaproteobacteria bacterium]|nr:hypothetical protein [Gammaproteobacteria bacterium]